MFAALLAVALQFTPYTASFVEAVDGDTLRVRTTNGRHVVHLIGIECPDPSRFCSRRSYRCRKEEKRGKRAMKRVEELAGRSGTLTIKQKDSTGFRREPLVTVTLPDGRDLATLLVSEKLCDAKR